jgi:hypothetical protein
MSLGCYCRILTCFLSITLVSSLQTATTIPYGIDKRPKPRGMDFEKLLSVNVGSFRRVSYIAPEGIQRGSAIYQSSSVKVNMQFGREKSQEDLQQTFRMLVSDATANGRLKVKTLSMGTDPSYVRMVDEQSCYFAWTRGLYFFTVDAKSDKDVDAFMQLFPY